MALACVAAVACVAAAVLGAMGSCIDDGTALCATTGRRCPVGYACTAEGDACTNTACGNGIQDPGEFCDDGNLQSNDGCIECQSDGRCGNNVIDRLTEECEPPNQRACDSRCQFRCDNGELDPDEECDRSRFRVTCFDLGFDRGTVTCNTSTCVANGAACAHIGWHRDVRMAEGTSPIALGDLHGVWAADNGQIYAVGTDATGTVVMILHFNGQSWRIHTQGPNQGTLLDVWGSGPQDVFAVGEGGRALYLNDSGVWLPLNTRLPADVVLRGVWGAGADGDVIAVGDAATIIRFVRSSGAWLDEPVRTSLPPDTVFEAVWGRSATEMYAVGHDGVIMHYTSPEWVREAQGLTGADLFDVWGSEDGAVFAVGAGGTILRRDQDGWSIMSSPQQGDLHALWGSGRDSVFAAGERGATLFYDGQAWRSLGTDTDSTLTDLSGVPGYGVVGVAPNGFILRLDGWGWMPLPAQENGDSMRSLWVREADDLFAVFDSRPYLRHFDGNGWSGEDIDHLLPETAGASPLRSVWGTPAGDLYVVGEDELVLRHRAATGWERMDVPDTIPASHLAHGWSSSDGHLFVIGELAGQSDGIILRHDGVSWRQMSMPRQIVLRRIWGVSRDEVFAVGTGGAILRYDGNERGEFEPMDSGTLENLNAIWGDSGENIHVVGDRGVALAFNGNVWALSTNLTTEHLYDVWGGGADQVFAVGSGGALLHRNERKWAVVSSGTDQPLTSIGGVEGPRGRHRVVVFGGEGAAFRRFLVNDDAVAVY